MSFFIDGVQHELDVLNPGSVVMTVTADGKPINAAIKDPEGTWALGGKPDPWPSEKFARGIINSGANLHVLVAAE
jgi:hypothetical protein